MTRFPGAVSILISLVAASVPATATATSALAADPARAGASEGAQPAESVAEPTSPKSPATQSDQPLTWEELEALIPGLADVPSQEEALRDAETAEAGRWRPQICVKQAEIGSRIKRRRCYTLEQYVAANCRWSRNQLDVAAWCRDKDQMIEHLARAGFRE